MTAGPCAVPGRRITSSPADKLGYPPTTSPMGALHMRVTRLCRTAWFYCRRYEFALPVAALVTLVFVLFLPAAAYAVVPTSGSWAGTGPKLTFTVGSGGREMTDFTAPEYEVYCFSGGPGQGYVTTRIFTVPSVQIDASGNFDTTYHPTDPNAYGTLQISGSFTTKSTVSGKLNYNRDGCYGGADFTATTSDVGPNPSPGPTPQGGVTARPRGVAFASHCVRRMGRRVCAPPKPLKHHTYKGKASQGQAVSAVVDRNGRYVAFTLKGLRYSCADGTSGYEDVKIATGDHQRVSRKGTFSTEIPIHPEQRLQPRGRLRGRRLRRPQGQGHAGRQHPDRRTRPVHDRVSGVDGTSVTNTSVGGGRSRLSRLRRPPGDRSARILSQ